MAGATRSPTKGEKNPITLILEEALELILEAEQELTEEFGTLPLFVEAGGKGPSSLQWPENPESLTPEQVQQLVNMHGKAQVTQWLQEEAMRRMAESTMSPDGSDGTPVY